MSAHAVGAVQFLNPSDYTTNISLSNKPDADNTVHLVAWASSLPTNPFIEFEIASPTTLDSATVDGRRINNDTWDADLDISGLTDGSYTLTARLYSGTTQEAEVVRAVTVNSVDPLPPPSPNTVEMTYPAIGGSWGLNAPKDKKINGLIDVVASDGTEQVRATYTTSGPGTDPDWVTCGSAAVATNLTARIKCTLADGVSIGQVTAVAVVANDTPAPADPNPVADATGDAHRVTPYAQVAKEVSVDPEVLANQVLSTCLPFTATVTDQNTRPMAGTNVDIHAVGPDDQIRFGAIKDETTGEVKTSPFQAPDKSHVATARPAYDCLNKRNEGTQGDHNIPNQDDPQHIESTTGTNVNGQFLFALYSVTAGGTITTAWADVNDDDLLQAAETSGGSRIGWNEGPPTATRELFLDPSTAAAEAGSCQRVELLGKLGGSPDAGQNVDVHINGPDETVAFCQPADDSGGTPPNAGTHTGNADDATTRHIEGQLDSTGRFIFGVTAASEGTTTITAWADTLENDVQESGETAKSGSVSWAISGVRTISIHASKSKVAKGRTVKISGRIDGAVACEASQTVNLKSKRLSGGRFHTIASATSDTEGDYLFTVRVQSSRRYKTAVLGSDACDAATSRVITVKAI
jgi:hypothetical protein